MIHLQLQGDNLFFPCMMFSSQDWRDMATLAEVSGWLLPLWRMVGNVWKDSCFTKLFWCALHSGQGGAEEIWGMGQEMRLVFLQCFFFFFFLAFIILGIYIGSGLTITLYQLLTLSRLSSGRCMRAWPSLNWLINNTDGWHERIAQMQLAVYGRWHMMETSAGITCREECPLSCAGSRSVHLCTFSHSLGFNFRHDLCKKKKKSWFILNH